MFLLLLQLLTLAIVLGGGEGGGGEILWNPPPRSIGRGEIKSPFFSSPPPLIAKLNVEEKWLMVGGKEEEEKEKGREREGWGS